MSPFNPSPEAIARLLGEIGELLRARMPGPVKATFDAADDSLFELAEHTIDGAQQQRYFGGMRECRRRRAEVERDFLRRLHGLLAYPLPEGAADDEPELRRLSLIGEEELEETLAVSTMVSKAETQLAQPLRALNQRFGFLLQRAALDDESNPVGPARIANAFRAASSLLMLDSECRLVLFKLFERHVLGALEPVYSEINIRLANAGVLPTLPAATAPRPPRTAAPPPRPRPRAGAERPSTTPSAERFEEERQLLETVLDLLQGATARTYADGAGAAPDGAPLSAGTVLGALTRLQRAAAAADPLESLPPTALKSHLLQESQRLGDVDGRFAPQDENTIDLLGLLFDYVSRDENLPDPLQPLLARLHLPFVKAALQDRELLAQPDHPARLLLDELGHAAIGWSPHADPGQRLLARIRDTVQTLLAKYDGDTGMFERLLREFRGYVEATRRRAELAEQRAVEAALGRERLKLARRHVRVALAERMREHADAPPWVRHLLNRPWANYLVLLWLRQGESSAQFQEALAFADALLWSTRAGANEAERLRLRTAMPQLDAQLRQGLSTVAYHDSEVEQLAMELREYIRSRTGEIPAPEFVDRIGNVPDHADFGPGAEPDIEEQPTPERADEALLSRIRQLEPGTWFEFRPAEDEPERAKLSWVSPITGRCLFVNRTGLKVADLKPEELAQDVEAGLTRILEGANLLQRALVAVLDQLRASLPPVKDAGGTSA